MCRMPYGEANEYYRHQQHVIEYAVSPRRIDRAAQFINFAIYLVTPPRYAVPIMTHNGQLSLILLQLFEVALEVSLHLFETVAAEFLSRSICEHYRNHRFADYSGCRNSYYI